MMTKQSALVLGIGLVLVAGAGVLSLRALEEAPAAPDVKKLADQVSKQDWDTLSREGQKIAKKYDQLNDVMGVFKLRRPKTDETGTIGLGVGNKPGVILPDGIEAKILDLTKRIRKGDLDKNAADLKRLGEITAAVAGIALHKPSEKATMGGDAAIKKWEAYSKEMHDTSREFIKSLEQKTPSAAQVKAAAEKLHDVCLACHKDFRE